MTDHKKPENNERRFIMPGIALGVGDNMIYAYADDTTLKKTHINSLTRNDYKKYILIDSVGNVFKIKRAFFVKYRAFFGYNPLINLNPFNKGSREIWIDFEYESEVNHISLEDIREELKHRISQKKNFWKETYGELKELYDLIDKTANYEELFALFH